MTLCRDPGYADKCCWVPRPWVRGTQQHIAAVCLFDCLFVCSCFSVLTSFTTLTLFRFMAHSALCSTPCISETVRVARETTDLHCRCKQNPTALWEGIVISGSGLFAVRVFAFEGTNFGIEVFYCFFVCFSSKPFIPSWNVISSAFERKAVPRNAARTTLF